MISSPGGEGAPVLIAFGANIAPEKNLLAGLARLRQETGILALSTIYRTLAVGEHGCTLSPEQQPEYLNGAVMVAGDWQSWPLHDLLRTIEAEQGRQRGGDRYAPRVLDLDIAMMGERVVREGELEIPDPDIPLRPFLALALAELAPALIHPLAGVTLAEVAARFGPHPPGMRVEAGLTREWRSLLM